MARGLDAVQKAELAEFLERLLREGGYKTQSQWARDAGYHPVNLSNALNRSKEDGLDGYSLLKLIRAAAVRAESTPEALARRIAADGRIDETALRLEALEAQVAKLVTRDDLVESIETLRIALQETGAIQGTRGTRPAKARATRAAKG